MNENDNASQNNNDEILNASFISDTGEVMDVKMSIIDKDTPIYQDCENDEQFIKNCNYENLESTSITFDNIEEQMNQPAPIEPLDMNDSLGESIIKEIAGSKKEKTKHEEDFQAVIITKIKDDIKNPHTKKPAVKLLIESFGNLLSKNKFLSWLVNKLGYYFPSRLKTLIDNHEKDFFPRNCLPNDVLKEIYHFWIKNSIPSTDRRSSRDKMCITKMKHMHVQKHAMDFEDKNITEFTKIKKIGHQKAT